MADLINQTWLLLVRWRTWLFNTAWALVLIAPEVLNAPEVLAVFPAEYRTYVVVAGFLVNIWMRPRPAVVASDPEVRFKQIAKLADADFTGDQL